MTWIFGQLSRSHFVVKNTFLIFWSNIKVPASCRLYSLKRPIHTIWLEGSDSWFRKLAQAFRWSGCKVPFLSVPFIFQEECRMKIEHIRFPSVFSKLWIRVSEVHFYCVHTMIFGTNKIGFLKSDRVNWAKDRSCSRIYTNLFTKSQTGV